AVTTVRVQRHIAIGNDNARTPKHLSSVDCQIRTVVLRLLAAVSDAERYGMTTRTVHCRRSIDLPCLGVAAEGAAGRPTVTRDVLHLHMVACRLVHEIQISKHAAAAVPPCVTAFGDRHVTRLAAEGNPVAGLCQLCKGKIE